MKKLILLFTLFLSLPLFAQVSPQIQGAGAPTNPCTNGGQQYVDTTNHVLYGCPSSGSNWANLGLGNVYPKGTSLLPTIVASLSSYSQFGRGTAVPVSDGTSATDCTTGGGTTKVFCQYDGSAWGAVGGSSNITGGTCTNQAVTAISTSGVPTCTTLTSAFVNSSICSNGACGQNTTGSAASLSVSGQTGLITLTGITSTNRAKTVRDAADTLLELGGSYTPTGTWTSMTLVTPALGTPASGVMTNTTSATPAAQDNSTKLATTAYVDRGGVTPVFSTAVTALTTSASSSVILSGPTTMLASGSVTTGDYEADFEIIITTQGSGGTCTTGSVAISMGYANDTSTYAVSSSAGNITFHALNAAAMNVTATVSNIAVGAAGDFISVPFKFRAVTGTAITYQIIEVTGDNCTTLPVITVRPALYKAGY